MIDEGGEGGTYEFDALAARQTPVKVDGIHCWRWAGGSRALSGTEGRRRRAQGGEKGRHGRTYNLGGRESDTTSTSGQWIWLPLPAH